MTPAPTTARKPTAAAMRAANATDSYVGAGTRSPNLLLRLAKIIDRESGLPDLIEAADTVVIEYSPGRGRVFSTEFNFVLLDKLGAALKHAKGES